MLFNPADGMQRKIFSTRPQIDFNQLVPPDGYIPGVGRGARGFTTQADLGPGQIFVENEQVLLMAKKDSEEDDATAAAKKYANQLEDEEAERIYDGVEKYLLQRGEERRRRLEEKQELKPKRLLNAHFADLTQGVSEAERQSFAAIPDVPDFTRKRQAERQAERDTFRQFMPAPDSLFLEHLQAQQPTGSVAPPQSAQLGAALDTAIEGMSGIATRVEERVELPSGQAPAPTRAALKRLRNLHASLLASNPHYAPGWVNLIQLEQHAGRPKAALAAAAKAVALNPTAPTLWTEYALLQKTPDARRDVFARALERNPGCVELWRERAGVETTVAERFRVFSDAVKAIPASVELWKELISLEADPARARELLKRAVQCVPESVELWLALAGTQDVADAKETIRRARKVLPTELQIWVAAAHLQERGGDARGAETVVRNALKYFQRRKKFLPSRQQWFDAAARSEGAGFSATARALVLETLPLGLDATVNIFATAEADANAFRLKGCPRCATAALEKLADLRPSDEAAWLLYVDSVEPEGRAAAGARALARCFTEEIAIRTATAAAELGDTAEAQAVLERAVERLPASPKLLMAGVDLAKRSGAAATFAAFERACESAVAGPELFIDAVSYALGQGSADRADEFLREGTARFPHDAALAAHAARAYRERGELARAHAVTEAALRRNPRDERLYFSLARLHWGDRPAKARITLDQGLVHCANSLLLLRARAELEIAGSSRARGFGAAKKFLWEAVQKVRGAGVLWDLLAWTEPTRRRHLINAAKACGEGDPWVCCASARFFASKHLADKARSVAAQAVGGAGDDGDVWLRAIALERALGGDEGDLRRRFFEAAPHGGFVWAQHRPLGGWEPCDVDERVAAALESPELHAHL
eukprot:gnl/Chilomastix_cuspidata/2047.p1 GENE.gnl/Chilomastix_cuspidata/2047~~gnl/Chilomastix_cuspidata/2047.p1  ORF type:complete len:887 (-),score=406.30 gnl/Chilomastix_cuspidata/2047:158-2818(-)